MPKSNNYQLVKFIEKFDTKLERIDQRLSGIETTMVRNTASLDEHMRRTELAEAGIGHLREDIEPLKRHKAFVEGALKGVGLIATVASFAAALIKIISFFKH